MSEISNTDIAKLYANEITILKDAKHSEYEDTRAFLENELCYTSPRDYIDIKRELWEPLQSSGDTRSIRSHFGDATYRLLSDQEDEEDREPSLAA